MPTRQHLALCAYAPEKQKSNHDGLAAKYRYKSFAQNGSVWWTRMLHQLLCQGMSCPRNVRRSPFPCALPTAKTAGRTPSLAQAAAAAVAAGSSVGPAKRASTTKVPPWRRCASPSARSRNVDVVPKPQASEMTSLSGNTSA